MLSVCIIFCMIAIGLLTLYLYSIGKLSKNYINHMDANHVIGLDSFWQKEDTAQRLAQDSGLVEIKEFAKGNDEKWSAYCFTDKIVYVWIDQDGKTGAIPYTQVISDRYQFGYKKVSIGMKKAEVDAIFANSKRTTTYEKDTVYYLQKNGEIVEKHVDAFYDDAYDHSIGFFYDENDIVTDIYIGNGL